ncbi:sodium- and chloride-dependent neutral and basic amino acid transporter B(0+)-like isoform X2 [Lissotriton helveticus]
MDLAKIVPSRFLKCCKKPASTDQDSQAEQNDDGTNRATWSNKTEYLLSMVGYAVGLGNIWRFPYLTYKNGGGAFLIPYLIMMIFTGLPLYLLESALGQFAGLGPVLVWRAAPFFQGVGITMVIVSTLVCIYYNVIVAYALYYLFASFTKVLPWSYCFEGAEGVCSTHQTGICNVTSGSNNTVAVNLTWVKANNETCISNSTILHSGTLLSKEYWDKVALRRSSGLDETGVVVWPLALCLLLAWIMVAAALFKGIQSSGKVWKDAATQIFYSYSIAWGGLMTLSSYNKFNNDCLFDTIFVCVVNSATAIFAGFAIFSILGHMAHELNMPVSEVVDSGFSLAFIAYPEALTTLPVSPLWSILFFLMLLTLGFDTQFSTLETLTTAIQDANPDLMKRFRVLITAGCCTVLFLLGLPCVTQAGIYWVNLIDYFCGGWTLIIAAVVEQIGLCWVYGVNRFVEDLERMLGKKHWIFWLYWRACWFVISPLLVTAVLIWSLVTIELPNYGAIMYPTWGLNLGWCMTAFTIIWIPVVAIYKIWAADGTLFQRLKSVLKPAPNWGPASKKDRGERYKDMVDDKQSNAIETPAATEMQNGYDNVAYL